MPVRPAAPPVPEAEPLPSESACVFTLGGASCALHVRQIGGIVTLGPLTPVPGAPPALLGVVNVRGSVVPVIDVRPLAGVSGADVSVGTFAVVLEDGDLRAALAIDRVLGLQRYEHALAPPTAGRFMSLACGTLPSADGVVTLLDGPAILATVRRSWMPIHNGLPC